jgi:GTP-binding protein
MIMFKDPQFLLGCVSLEQLPAADYPEVAFAGRSNVGKSSLLNALTNRKQLARTSATPGRTRELNFFLLGEKLYLVDLPGYGYARASKSDVERWTKLTRRYLRGRPNLQRIFLLIDSRHGIKANDAEMMAMLDETAVNYQIVLTKADKLKNTELEKVMDKTTEELAKHGAAHPEVIVTSSEKGTGMDVLRREIVKLASYSI